MKKPKQSKASGGGRSQTGGLRAMCADIAGDDVSLTFIEGHDDAILGVAEDDGIWRVVYSEALIIRKLKDRDGMSSSGAQEFFEYNFVGAMLGHATPVFVKGS
ncbi:hypothetical protein [Acidovorax soli]|uniref:Uncharacterized protein n=1 Tax=Acidovorax soli TaxID=592050 RepID=A0A1H4EXF8_9BURK|nr:hypothetical protein [Acidovorax soli]SEA89743.1 hypothetical protein SAMN05421875_1439 [Acidovorax soli]